MNKNTNAENQRRFVADKKKQGLRRLILWVRPEDVEPLKEISRQPHTIAKRRAKVRAEIERELCPAIKAKVAAQLERKTRRALLIQKRTQARLHPASSNRPPSRLRFETRPPATIRDRIKADGWVYDPVAAVWHLPDDPDKWPALERLLSELAASFARISRSSFSKLLVSWCRNPVIARMSERRISCQRSSAIAPPDLATKRCINLRA